MTEKLRELPGIGDWTAQYIAMRALRWPNAFPASDLGLQKAWSDTSVQRLSDASEAWSPCVLTQPSIFGKVNTSAIRRTTMIESTCRGVYYSVYSSPIGELLLTSDGEALTGLTMCQHRGSPPGTGGELAAERLGFSTGQRAVRRLFQGHAA